MRTPLTVLCLLALVGVARANVACPPPYCDIPVPKQGLIVPDNNVRVIVPANYDPNGTKKYPVLYLLHGAGDFYKTWSQNTDIVALTRTLDLIIVMPSSGGTCGGCGESGWYTDWADGSRQWESFHIGVMIPFIDQNFATLGDGHRAVAGLSMGGYGAMKYAAKYPGKFQAAASFSGAVDIRYGEPVNYVVFRLANPFLGTPDDRVWGNQVLDEANWRANNPADLIGQYVGTGIKLLLATGNGLPGGAHDDPMNPGGAALENGIWQMNLSFRNKLDAAGVAHTDLFYGPGIHSWPYWRDDLCWSLPQILAAIN